jgi:hypothetical protein
MNPHDEFKDLVSRSRRLIDAALLLVITGALLVVAAGTLFCTVFITTFSTVRAGVDRVTARTSVWKAESLNVL